MTDEYTADAQSWELDKAARDRRFGRIGLTVGAVGSLLALIQGVALTQLLPLKELVPIPVRIESRTGVVDVQQRYEGTGKIEWPLTEEKLRAYVTSRERLVWGVLEGDYDLVASMQPAALNEKMAAAWAKENPASPLNVFKDGTTIAVKIGSVTRMQINSGRGGELAQVRFTRTQRAGGFGTEQVSHWIATLEYAYVPRTKRISTDEEDRKQLILNPLNLIVSEYQRDQEAVSSPLAAVEVAR